MHYGLICAYPHETTVKNRILCAAFTDIRICGNNAYMRFCGLYIDPNANWENIFRYAPISANQVDYPYTVSFRYALMRFGYPHMRLHFPITHDSFMQIRKIQAHIRGYLTPLFIINTIEGVGENYPIIIILIF